MEQFFTSVFEHAPNGSFFYAARIIKATKQAYPKFYDDPSDLWTDAKNHREADLADFYFSPAFYSRKTKAVKSNVRGAGVAWVDCDAGLPEFEQEPNYILETSPDHFHCYWLLGEMRNADEIESINRELAYSYNTDKSGWDRTQLLRPPLSFNRKRNNFRTRIERSDTNSIADFSQIALGNSTTVDEGSAGTGGSSSIEQVLAGLVLTKREQDLIFRETDTKSSQGRSGVIFNLACCLVKIGATDAEIFVVLDHTDRRLGKYTNHSDRIGTLQGIIASARKKEKTPETKEITHRPLYQKWIGNIEFFQDITEDEYHCEHIVFEDGMLIIGGEPGAGKSRLALNLIDCLACGRDFLGKKVKRAIKCAYLGLDMPARRVRGIRQQQFAGFSKDERELINQNVTLLIRGSGMSLIDPKIQAQVTADFLESEAEFIVIDVLGRALPTLKDDEVAQPFLNWLQEYINIHHASFGLVTHTRKSQVGNKSAFKLDDWFGSRYWSITPDTGFTIEDQGKDSDMILHINKDRSGELGDEMIIKKDYTTSLYTIVTSGAAKDDKSGKAVGGSGINI